MGYQGEIGGEMHKPLKFDRSTVLAMMEADLFPEGRKVEMIDGVLLEMSPANNKHGVVLVDVIAALRPLLMRDMKGATDVAIFLDDRVMLAPDFAVLPKNILTQDARGNDLLLAVEVADSSIERDLGLKANLYSHYGVAELWVVDIPGERLHVHREPASQGYGLISVHDWSETLSPLALPDANITLSEVIEL